MKRVNVRGVCVYESPYTPRFEIITEGPYYGLQLQFDLDRFTHYGITPKWHPPEYLTNYNATVERVDFMVKVCEPIEAWITLVEFES